MTTVTIMDTGVANIASMLASLARLGVKPVLSTSPDEIMHATHAVLPGVGAFGAGMARIQALGLERAIAHRFERDLPTLCVCLGLQLLFESSDESPDTPGLGLLPGHISKFEGSDLRVPQLGWNHVQNQSDAHLLSEAGYAYYANSYRLIEPPEGWDYATSEYGGAFIAAIARGRWLACQFHPELSSQWGALLMQRWIKGA